MEGKKVSKIYTDDCKPDLLVAFSEGVEVYDNDWGLLLSLIKHLKKLTQLRRERD